jgi:hypothetical protein
MVCGRAPLVIPEAVCPINAFLGLTLDGDAAGNAAGLPHGRFRDEKHGGAGGGVPARDRCAASLFVYACVAHYGGRSAEPCDM